MPDDVIIPGLEEDIVQFIKTTKENRKSVDDVMAKQHAAVLWDSDMERAGCVTLTCILPSSKATSQTKTQWPQQVEAAFMTSYRRFTIEKVDVFQDSWAEFLRRASNLFRSDSDVTAKHDGEQCCVAVVGKIDVVRSAAQKFHEVLENNFRCSCQNYFGF